MQIHRQRNHERHATPSRQEHNYTACCHAVLHNFRNQARPTCTTGMCTKHMFVAENNKQPGPVLTSASVCETPIRLRKATNLMEWQVEQTSR